MLDLNDHYYFVQAVDHGGFAAAGRMLDLPKSTISRRVIALEKRLGVTLIERSSRSFVVTDIGQEFYQHAKAVLIEAQSAEDVVAKRMAEPSGTVRMTCSVGMARMITPIVVQFLSRYAGVNLTLETTNRNVDLIEEGFDIGLRGHSQPLPDSNLVQKSIASTPWALFAAPAYLNSVSPITNPMDLNHHATLAIGSSPGQQVWDLYQADQHFEVIVHPRLLSTDMETLKSAAIAAQGVVSLPVYIAAREVADKSLVSVLPGWLTQQAQISLVTPYRRSQLPAVRTLIDFLAEEFPPLLDAAPVSDLSAQ